MMFTSFFRMCMYTSTYHGIYVEFIGECRLLVLTSYPEMVFLAPLTAAP